MRLLYYKNIDVEELKLFLLLHQLLKVSIHFGCWLLLFYYIWSMENHILRFLPMLSCFYLVLFVIYFRIISQLLCLYLNILAIKLELDISFLYHKNIDVEELKLSSCYSSSSSSSWSIYPLWMVAIIILLQLLHGKPYSEVSYPCFFPSAWSSLWFTFGLFPSNCVCIWTYWPSNWN